MKKVALTHALSLLLLAGILGISPAAAQEQPVILAHKVTSTLHIDGRLDEADWSVAAPASGFRQFEPTEGAAPSAETEVRVLYGPAHLYVGARLFDKDPQSIQRTLGRRDELNRADWFLVSIDSYHDQKTAYTFGVNAAGVQFDATNGQDGDGGGGPNGGFDASWDAIWTSEVQHTVDGWIVEMRIPYSMLRFAEADVATWGIQFVRRIPRLGEVDEWPMVPRTDRDNLVARFAELRELRGIRPRRNVEIRPYTMASLHADEDPAAPGTWATDNQMDIGGDLKIGLGPNVTLDATINPDFGQVEADPAVMNLTAFETFYEERRPFFVEGSQIFQFGVGPGQLLYTRRIGGEAPILGAAKLSGRSAGGTSFGLMGATTGHSAEPQTHYGVARVSQQFAGTSSIGGAATLFSGASPDGRRTSVAGGANWDLRFQQDRYGVQGFMALTHREHPTPGLDAQTGVAGQLWVVKRQGTWSGFVGLDVFGDTFNPNDVGQFQGGDFVGVLSEINHEFNGGRAFGPFLRASFDIFNFQTVAYSNGLNLGLESNGGFRGTFRSFQEIGIDFRANRPFGGYDLFETRGLGPWTAPAEYSVGAEFETDSRKTWQLEPELRLGWQEGGGSSFDIGMRSQMNIGTRLTLHADFELEHERNALAWSANETFRRTAQGWYIGATRRPESDDDFLFLGAAPVLDGALVPGTNGRVAAPMFGARDTRAFDATLRSDVTLSPHLSIQLYTQLFAARGRYQDFQVMKDRDNLVPFDAYPKRDEFSLNSLQLNTVLRWEYRPGSTLYLVWTHGRRGDHELNPLAPWGRSPYENSLDDQIGDIFDLFPSNVFLIKLNYAFLR